MTVLDRPRVNGVKPRSRSLLGGLSDHLGATVTPKTTKVRKRLRVAERLKTHAVTIRHSLFAAVGFGAPTVAAWEWHHWAGWIATGVAALLFEYTVVGAEGGDQP
jgi:hypothetical protein